MIVNFTNDVSTPKFVDVPINSIFTLEGDLVFFKRITVTRAIRLSDMKSIIFAPSERVRPKPLTVKGMSNYASFVKYNTLSKEDEFLYEDVAYRKLDESQALNLRTIESVKFPPLRRVTPITIESMDVELSNLK